LIEVITNNEAELKLDAKKLNLFYFLLKIVKTESWLLIKKQPMIG